MLQVEMVMIILLVAVLVVYLREEHRLQRTKIPSARVQYFWNGPEQREQERVNLVFKARYQVTRDLKNTSREGLTDNISSSGLKLIVYEKLKVGDEVEMEIEIPPHEILKCKGEIVWVKDLVLEEYGSQEKEKRSFAVGLRFTDLQPEVSERLGFFVNQNTSSFTAQAA